MAWYAAYDKETGELYSTGTVIYPSELLPHLELKNLNKAVDFEVMQWDKHNKHMVEKVEVP